MVYLHTETEDGIERFRSRFFKLKKAGYGSRTRLSSLGSWRTTDVLTLRSTKSILQILRRNVKMQSANQIYYSGH